MERQEQVRARDEAAPAFRLDLRPERPAVQPHSVHAFSPSAGERKEGLPEAVFPQYPKLLAGETAASVIGQPHIPPARRRWSAPMIYRTMRGWLFPYIQSRLLPGDFHPIICYLFTEYKCNLDCHYCWAFDNHVKGMTEGVAKTSIDWLHDTTCRVLALMGGEPLLRPAFVHKVVYHAAKKGFWV